jgi:hypothetical protein
MSRGWTPTLYTGLFVWAINFVLDLVKAREHDYQRAFRVLSIAYNVGHFAQTLTQFTTKL